MGRLIDTDAITDFMLEHNIPDSLFASVEEIVAYQPTAFNVEAVVKELDDLKFSYFFTLANTGEAVNDFAYKNVGNAIDKAIEIVKGGVK